MATSFWRLTAASPRAGRTPLASWAPTSQARSSLCGSCASTRPWMSSPPFPRASATVVRQLFCGTAGVRFSAAADVRLGRYRVRWSSYIVTTRAPDSTSGAHEPTGRRKPDLRAVHIRSKRGADRLNDLEACCFVRLRQNATERAHLGEVAVQVPLWCGAGHVDRLDIDVRPTRTLQDRGDSASIGERELPGRIWHARRDVREEADGGTLGRGHERILNGVPPRDEPEFRAVTRGS